MVNEIPNWLNDKWIEQTEALIKTGVDSFEFKPQQVGDICQFLCKYLERRSQ